MLDSVSSIATLSTQLSIQKTAQQVDVAVLKKAQDMQEQQGQNMLQLIASTSVPSTGIDVHV
jgi:hypothetical protein